MRRALHLLIWGRHYPDKHDWRIYSAISGSTLGDALIVAVALWAESPWTAFWLLLVLSVGNGLVGVVRAIEQDREDLNDDRSPQD